MALGEYDVKSEDIIDIFRFFGSSIWRKLENIKIHQNSKSGLFITYII